MADELEVRIEICVVPAAPMNDGKAEIVRLGHAGGTVRVVEMRDARSRTRSAVSEVPEESVEFRSTETS